MKDGRRTARRRSHEDIGGDPYDRAGELEGLKLWIDDVREAPPGFRWFRSVVQFIGWCHERRTFAGVALVDLDFDAGEYAARGGDYANALRYLERCGVRDVVVHVHSSNVVGAAEIRRVVSRNKANGWREVRNGPKRGRKAE